MNGVFYKATDFNQPLDDWNVKSVTSMKSMFREASNFNQSLDNWDVKKG
jgi:surface protein